MIPKEKFHGDVGSFITSHDALARTTRFKKRKEEQGYKPDTFTRAEFFGSNRINHLLGRKDCVGIRIYYGKRHEDADENPVGEGEGDLKARMVIVGVRADGSDIFDDTTGLKDGGDGDALGDGNTCPRHCPTN